VFGRQNTGPRGHTVLIGAMVEGVTMTLGVRWHFRMSAAYRHTLRRAHVTSSTLQQYSLFSARHSTLFLLSMGDDVLVNVHETLQDSLDVVSMANSMNTPSTHLCSASISAFIYHGTITSTGEFGTSDHPSICKPRRLSDITRFSVTSEFLRVQR
jgi:hypothetical protein